jgi:hypothetical protein
MALTLNKPNLDRLSENTKTKTIYLNALRSKQCDKNKKTSNNLGFEVLLK